MRRVLAAALGLLWLMPSAVACLVGLHVALLHHVHEHAGDDDPAHRAEHVEATSLVANLVHGHHHEEAHSREHSHDVLLPFAKLSERLAAGDAPSARATAQGTVDTLPTGTAPADSRSSLPLFRTHCALLI